MYFLDEMVLVSKIFLLCICVCFPALLFVLPRVVATVSLIVAF